MTDEILGVQWVSVTLYPAGYVARRITVQPNLKLPAGWQYATALETATARATKSTSSRTTWKPDRFAAVRRPLLQAVRPRPGRQGAGAPERVRRHAGSLDAKPEQIEATASWSAGV
jgi:hypothetical protein